MLVRGLRTLESLSLSEVLVVTGPEHDRVQALLNGHQARLVFNPDHAQGMGSSIAAGVRAVRPENDFLIALADMPFIPASLYHELLAAASSNAIVTASHASIRTPPVWFSTRYRSELEGLRGDAGAQVILRRHSQQVTEVEGPTEWFRDIDEPSDLC